MEGITSNYVHLLIVHAQAELEMAQTNAEEIKLSAVADALDRIIRDIGGIRNNWEALIEMSTPTA